MKNTKYLITFLLFLLNSYSYGQNRVIFGTVISALSGRPIAGVKVEIKDTDFSAIANSSGQYSITLPERIRTVKFSDFRGMEVFEIKHVSEEQIDIYLLEIDLMNLTLDELMKIKVITATKKEERISTVPASMVVITKEQIEERGYGNLVEIFNDLPGIDLSIAYGDTYYKAYWRGFRTGMSDSWLLIVDGRVMNHLWYNFNDVLDAIPLSNIEQIEVVYGPASVVYGPNAMTGVVQILTKKDEIRNGMSANVKLTTGSFENRNFDMNFFYKLDDLRLSITAYAQHGDLDKNSLNNYEYTKASYLSDRKLWGAYVDNQNIAGKVSSPQNIIGFAASIFYSDIEFGFRYYSDDTGYGINYPFDRMQILPKWVEPEYELFIQHTKKYSEKFSTSSIVRYRDCSVSNESNSIENWGEFGEPRKLAFGYWQSKNRSLSLFQDFNYDLTEILSFSAGFKYDYKDMQRAYELPYGLALAPDDVQLDLPGLFPTPPEDTYRSENRAIWIEEALYLQSRVNFGKLLKSEYDHFLNMDIRYDDNTYYGSDVTFRVGYTGVIDRFRGKILFGQAFKEPAPRQLFGGWAALGSNPNLEPEYSETLELVLGYNSPQFDISINPYFNSMRNIISDISAISKNQGKMTTAGVDVIVQTIIPVPFFKKLSIWGTYSYLYTKEDRYDDLGNVNGYGIIGDMADHKFHLIVDASLKDFNINIRTRFIGNRNTVISNPVEQVDAYTTTDINLKWDNLLSKNFGLSLRITNLFNAKFNHTGIRKANSGKTPGYWVGDKWYGSLGWYNSLLPQPGVGFFISMYYKL